MRQLPRPRKATEATGSSGRRRKVELPPEVPTYQPQAVASPAPPATLAKEDPAHDAIRRMVEAAYT